MNGILSCGLGNIVDLLEIIFVCYDDDNACSCITREANDTTWAKYISACHVNDTFTQNHTIFMYLTPKSQLMTSNSTTL
jgi:hypothetical protein